MLHFDPSRLTEAERAAYLARLDRYGPVDFSEFFAITTEAVRIMENEGTRPEEITATIMNEYRSAEELMVLGPVIRRQTIILVEAMVRQALEVENPVCPGNRRYASAAFASRN